MGLGIAIGGSIAALTIFVMMLTLSHNSSLMNEVNEARSEINQIQDRISKSNHKIHSMGAEAGNKTISFNFTNNGSEKYWNFEKFNLYVTYEGDVLGSTQLVTESLIYNATGSFQSTNANGGLGCSGICTIDAADAQFARPDEDVFADEFSDNGGSGDNDGILYDELDEVIQDNGDYIRSDNISAGNPNQRVEIGLTDLEDPFKSSGHVVRYAYARAAFGLSTIDVDVRLLQGVTEIASWSHTNIGTGFVTAEQTLTGVEADAITDYTDLRIEITGSCSLCLEGNRVWVSWVEMEIEETTGQDISAGDSAACSSGVVSSQEWSVFGISGDYLDPQIINPNEVSSVCANLSNDVVSGGVIEVWLITDLGKHSNYTAYVN